MSNGGMTKEEAKEKYNLFLQKAHRDFVNALDRGETGRYEERIDWLYGAEALMETLYPEDTRKWMEMLTDTKSQMYSYWVLEEEKPNA